MYAETEIGGRSPAPAAAAKGEIYTAAEYAVFPGISVIYHNSHAQEGALRESGSITDDVFEIFHCREGRMECGIGNDFCYISPGDLLIVKTANLSSTLYFPLRHYHGITIRINKIEAPKCLSCFLQDVTVQPKAIEEKFCGKNSYYIARSDSSVEHIFSELYAVPEEIRQGYCRIKILELMLFLSVYKIKGGDSGKRSVSPSQAKLAKTVAKYLAENMAEKNHARTGGKQISCFAHRDKNSLQIGFRFFVLCLHKGAEDGIRRIYAGIHKPHRERYRKRARL